MALYAIGDVQGCDDELAELLEALDFSAGRDRLWFVGDLVNRGPRSLAVLRRIRALGEAATVVLGNHDLHCLAVARGCAALRGSDTLDELLGARDRDALLDWLISRPLMHLESGRRLALVHAGLAPQWSIPEAIACAREMEHALQHAPERLFQQMYGDQPDRWSPSLEGDERLRFIANCLTRLRYLDADDRLVMRVKASPNTARTKKLIPWFEAEEARWRGTRVVFGHWSTLGFYRNADVIGLDTGCVWGGSLTAIRLDGADSGPVAVGCGQSAAPG